MKADHTWRGMIIKDNEGDWGICVAAWRGMKKGKAGIPGDYSYFPNLSLCVSGQEIVTVQQTILIRLSDILKIYLTARRKV